MDIIELLSFIVYLIIAIIYSSIYALILNYILKRIFKKFRKTKPFILNYYFIFFGIVSLILFFKLNRKTSYYDFHNRYIPVSKNYRIENNEGNMTFFYPDLMKQDFNNDDAIFFKKINFDKDNIYGELPQKNDSINVGNYEKTYALNSKYLVFNISNKNLKRFSDSIMFNAYAKENNLKTADNLKSFDDLYVNIIEKNKWKKILFLQY